MKSFCKKDLLFKNLCLRIKNVRPYESVAQSVEHLAFNQGVVGSSPTGLTSS